MKQSFTIGDKEGVLPTSSDLMEEMSAKFPIPEQDWLYRLEDFVQCTGNKDHCGVLMRIVDKR